MTTKRPGQGKSSIKSFPFTPGLGWSATRYETFSICKRKYFYQYYSKYDPQVEVRLIQQLRGLTSIPLVIGSATHEVIETLLNRLVTTNKDIDREQFFDYAYRTTRHHAEHGSFHEVFYNERDSVAIEELYPKVQECLQNLLDSDRYRWLVGEASQTSAQWVIEPPGYGETRLDGLKAYFKVDFLFPVGEHYHILDWKTGKRDPEKHRKQLVGYSAWASYHFEVGADSVIPTIAYLHPTYEEVEEVFNDFDLEHFAIQVRAETDEMREYCLDVEQNIPRDKDQFALVVDDKPAEMRRQIQERICSHCEYRGLCFPDQYPIQAELWPT